MTEDSPLEIAISDPDSIISLTQSAVQRIEHITTKYSNNDNALGTFVRLSVAGGGCDGFVYKFELDHNHDKENDILIHDNTNKLIFVIKKKLIKFVNGSIVNFNVRVGKSMFEVNNPNATSSCGCGTSFSLKN